MDDDNVDFRAWLIVYLVEHWWQVSLMLLTIPVSICLIIATVQGRIDWP